MAFLKWPSPVAGNALSRWDYYIHLLFMVAFVAIPIMATLAHKAFAPALFIIAIACASSTALWGSAKTLILRPIKRSLFEGFYLQITIFSFTLLCLWVLISSFWTPLNGRTFLFLNLLLPPLAAGAIVWRTSKINTHNAQKLSFYFCLSVILALILLAFEVFSNGLIRLLTPPLDTSWSRHKDMVALGRGTTAMMVMVFPAMLITRHITKTWLAAIAIFLIASISAFGFSIAANALGLMAGLMALLMVWRFPVIGMRIITFGVLLGLWGSPLIAIVIPADSLNQQLEGVLPVSWLQRFYIWEAMGDAIINTFPLGGGVDYARFLSNNSPYVDIAGAYGPLKTVPNHPHNVFLQLWLELGLIGVLLTTIAFYYGAKCLSALTLAPQTRAIIAAITATTFISFMVEASLWQVWRISILGFSAFGVVLHHKITNPSQNNHSF